ncbi:MAG: hypothetical protein EBT79_07585 [Actinobacteria bacterium]|nr:hypothetical protein [Actinomycetota bacterium]NBR67121.1 hypothetical protein [Actinomycetota bacterium]
MSIVRQVELARIVAARMVGRVRADDVAHDVAVVLLEWPWYTWGDAAVSTMAEEFARAALEHEARHVPLRQRW